MTRRQGRRPSRQLCRRTPLPHSSRGGVTQIPRLKVERENVAPVVVPHLQVVPIIFGINQIIGRKLLSIQTCSSARVRFAASGRYISFIATKILCLRPHHHCEAAKPGLAGLELRVTAAWPGSPHSQPATPPRFSPLYSTESVQARAYLQRSPFLSHAQCSRSSGTEDAALSPRALSARSPAYSRGSFPALAVLLPIRSGGGMPVHVSFKSSRHDGANWPGRCIG